MHPPLLFFVQIRQRISDYNETPKGYFVTIEAEFQNLKDKKITIIWKENSNRQFEIINSNIDFIYEDAFEVSTKIELEASAIKTGTITLFTPKRD